MTKKMTVREDIIRFLKVSENYWTYDGCDICDPIPLKDLEEFLLAWNTRNHEPAPWLCEEHARELDLLW